MRADQSRPAILRRTRRPLAAATLAAAILLAFPSLALAVTDFAITGGGWGHGIGLSQWGARGYALQGRSHSWILTHYYQGTRITTSAPVTVKVAIDDGATARSSWPIAAARSADRLVVTDYDQRTVRIVLEAGKRYWITALSGNVRVHADRESAGSHSPGAVLKTFSGIAYASAGSSSLVRVLSASGPFNRTDVAWRGSMVFVPSGSLVHARNYVNIESYLYGVVPRESPSSWPAEALEAQAVAARSYAWQDAADGRVLYCTTRSQVYAGYSQGSDVLEAATTNAAVNATKGQVVRYGTAASPVKTFFSSSSGGHTASIRDVWPSSTPQPYYTGVPDADQDSPYYRWGPITLTDSQLAERLRSHDISSDGRRDRSSAAPAVVRSVSLSKASSGYVRYATFTWSDGKSYTLTGDSVRQALGLRSTKFSFQALVRTPDRVEEDDLRIAWAGAWTSAYSSAFSDTTERQSAQAGATAFITFQGRGITWVGTLGPRYGKANVYLDGVYRKTVDLYASQPLFRRGIWTVTGLSTAVPHTLRIKVLGARNPAATASLVGIDAVDLSAATLVQAAIPVTRYEQTASAIATTTGWQTGFSDALSGGSQMYTSSPGTKAYLAFSGTGLTLLGSKAPTYGRVRVTLDGGTPEVVDLYSATPLYTQRFWSRSGLPDRPHSVVIEALGAEETTRQPGYLSIDAVEVETGVLRPADLPAVRLEESRAELDFTGPWTRAESAAMSGGAFTYSSTAGAEASVTFRGTGATWIGNRSPRYGKANVYLDGRYLATLDLYAAKPSYGVTLFSRRGLPTGTHTLRIRVLGMKNAASSGTAVGLDAVDVFGEALP